jgi:hypothetical protein
MTCLPFQSRGLLGSAAFFDGDPDMTYLSNAPAARQYLAGFRRRSEAAMASLPAGLPLALRVALAVPFFKSGLTKLDGFLTLSDGAVFLFAQEFRLHVFGYAFPFPAPLLTAALAGERPRSCCPSCWFSDWARGSPRLAFS